MTRALFLHAFGADRLTWAGTSPALPGVTAITPDLPGHGTAVAGLETATLAAFASAVLPLLEAQPAWIIGHSLGGGVALHLAATRPDLCQGLILLAPLGLGTMRPFDGIDAYANYETPAEMRGFLESLVADKSLIAQQFVDYALAQSARPGARAALAQIAAALPAMEAEAHAALPLIAKAQVPVSVLWGDADPVIAPDPDKIGQVGDVMTLPGIGHIPHVEAMKAVNAFLKERIV